MWWDLNWNLEANVVFKIRLEPLLAGTDEADWKYDYLLKGCFAQ